MRDWVFANRVPILVALLVFSLGMGVIAAWKLRVDNSPDIWLPSGDPEISLYERFKSRFGEDGFLALVHRPSKSLSRKAVKKEVMSLKKRLSSLHGVRKTHTPFDNDWEDRISGESRVLDQERGDDEGLAIEDPMAAAVPYRKGGPVALLLSLESGRNDAERKRLVHEVEKQASKSFDSLGPSYVVGTDVVTRDLDVGSEQSFGALFPLVALVLSVVVFFALRSFAMLGSIFLASIGAIVCTMGAMGIANRSLNLLVVLIPAILIVLAVAASLHLCARYIYLRGEGAPKLSSESAWKLAWSDTLAPSVLTTVTTMVGFGSLAVSDLRPVRDLGVFTAVGAFFVWIFVFVGIPLALLLNKPSKRWRRAQCPKTSLIERYCSWIHKHRRSIFATSGCVAVLSVVGASAVVLESHVLRFFPSGHSLVRGYENFEKNFFGLTPFEVWVEGHTSSLTDTRTLKALHELHSYARREKLVTGSILPLGDASEVFVKDSQSFAEMASPWLLLRLGGSKVAKEHEPFLWSQGENSALRFTLTAPTTSSNKAYEAVVKLREKKDELVKSLPKDLKIRISGAAPLLVRGQVLLLQTQIRSFVLALLLISAVILFAYRSIHIALISLIPNLLPIVVTLGMMGLLKIPLNAGTVTVAGIALGLVIDDTIHILHHYASYRTKPALEATRKTLAFVVKPVAVTSSAVALGFALFTFAPFRPTFYFGLLIAVTSIFALLCDLVLLPTILVASGKGKSKAFGANDARA